MEKLNIKISLANRLYPMTIKSSEEKLIRVSVAKIEKILKNFKENYSVKDDQDLLAMCALHLCVKLENLSISKRKSDQQIIKDLLDINKSVSDSI
tara:strand:+ start:84 stop:368 length:285 start_codon:yes stop_codon:yes gene_type:complete